MLKGVVHFHMTPPPSMYIIWPSQRLNQIDVLDSALHHRIKGIFQKCGCVDHSSKVPERCRTDAEAHRSCWVSFTLIILSEVWEQSSCHTNITICSDVNMLRLDFTFLLSRSRVQFLWRQWSLISDCRDAVHPKKKKKGGEEFHSLRIH